MAGKRSPRSLCACARQAGWPSFNDGRPRFSRGGSVLDVGAGSGEPLTAALIEDGFDICAIDASASLVAAFRRRFPAAEVACEAAEHSRFFNRTFDGVLAVGLVFLLAADRQRQLIRRLAAALNPGGRLLFSAPHQVCVWDDLLTGQPSSSLGAEAYRRIIAACGLRLALEQVDEGGNYYYEAYKPSARATPI